MDINTLPEGYYKTYHQEWWESTDDKHGFAGTGWGEDEGFELVCYLEENKYGNPIKALFKYEGPVFLGMQHAAFNIQANLLSEFVSYAKEYHGQKFEDIYKVNPEFKKLNDAIDIIEERYEIKNYRHGK